MNPNSIDYLYQVTTTVPDRAPSSGRTDDNSSGFDDHLNQASSTVFDVIRPTSRASNGSIYSTSNNSSSSNRHDTAPNSPIERSDNSPPPQNRSSSDTHDSTSPPLTKVQPHEASRHRGKDSNDHSKKDHTENDQVAAAAGAPQPAAKEDAPDVAATNDAAVKSANEVAEAKAVDNSDAQPAPTDATTNDGSTISSKDEATNVADKVTVAATDKIAANAQVPLRSDKQDAATVTEASKTGKRVETTSKARSAASANDKVQAASQAKNQVGADLATSTSTQTTTTENASIAAQSNADTKQAAPQTNAKTALKAGDGNATGGDKESVKATAQNDAVVSDINTNIAAVANIVVPTIADNSNDAVKTKSTDDDAIKSVSAKGETAVGPLGRSLRTDLASGSREIDKNDTPQIDPSRFVSRVAKAVQTANDRGGPLQLRLSPPELGSLKIQLSVKDGGLSASLEADNSNARKLLLDHLPALRDRLAEQNIRVDRFDVDLKQENGGGQTNSRGSNQNPYQQQEQQSGVRRAPNTGSQAAETTVPVTSTQVASVSSSGINLVI